ncbi:MAG: hypothetical protein WKF93_12395 [Acidimicrobiales bacterium]
MKLEVFVDAVSAARRLDGMVRRSSDATPLLQILGDELLEYAAGAFATRGYGQWATLDPATVRAKGNGRVLVDNGGLLADLTSRGSLRRSGETVTLSTDETSAGYLKRGARGMPQRNPTPPPPSPVVNGWAREALGFLVEGRR